MIFMEKRILEISSLSVKYGEDTALDIRNKLCINQGDVVGVIGENGAGKSTLVNAILGEIKYQGEIVRNFEFEDVGVQFQENNYNIYLKVEELIKIVTGYSAKSKELAEVLKQFELTNLLKKKIGVLSGGEKQRLTMFLVLYLKPKVLFLDELTTGLDYKKREQILSILKDYAKNKTIFSVTHYFDELNNFANKIIILHKGKCLYCGLISDLEKKIDYYRVVKIKNNLENNMDSVLKIIKRDDNYIYIVTNNETEHKIAVKNLEDSNAEYEVMAKNLYSLYMMALYIGNGGENNA